MIAVTVILNSTREFDREYDYAIPDNLIGKVVPGVRVSVPFGKSDSIREAYVIGIKEKSSVENLKEIDRLIDNEPVLDKYQLQLGAWMKRRYVCTYFDAFRCMIPVNSTVKAKTVRIAYLARDPEEITELIEGTALKSIQQIRVLEILLENEFVATTDLCRFARVSPGVLKTLSKYGHIEFGEIEVVRNPSTLIEPEQTSDLELTEEQQSVMTGLLNKIETGEFTEALLHGITGSGKTEVYMQLIKHILHSGKQAIVLVPEISLTPQMIARFKGRFGKRIAVIHSKLSHGEKYDQWKLIREGSVDVVVGARSAVFAPFTNLGAIIIDEEHESSYKSELTPKYDAREIARQRCRQHKALLLMGTATPSVTTFFKEQRKPDAYYYIGNRPHNISLPTVELVDMRDELSMGNRSILSKKLTEAITENIKKKEQTILLLNRRGHSSFVLCRNCGEVIKCRNCNITLTYHSYNDRLICHYCGYTVHTPSACPSCGGRQIRFFGTGTQKVEDEIKNIFPEATVLRMDMDTTSRKNSHEKILKQFDDENINILLGTQMIAKGLDYPNVTLVGVIAADSILNMDDYRASERTFQLITQVSGRAGRGDLKGRVLVQTYNTDAYSIQSACRNDYEGFYKQEIMLREQMGYPPFTKISTAVISGSNENLVRRKADELKKMIEDVSSRINIRLTLIGPCVAPVSRIKGEYRWRIIIKCSSLARLVELLTTISDKFASANKRLGVRLSVDIDPVSMV
ncbi:MAG: primosomal protein N' [Eubacteriales bacterium]|nr:primosomal protein N' [Eubacteriales bacterium]